MLVLGLTLLACVGCGGDDDRPEVNVSAPSSIDVSSSVLTDGGPIPRVYTCDGEGVSPPLSWDGVPAGTAALALVVDDPDAPGGTYTHWVVLDMPPDLAGLDEGETAGVAATNSAGKAAWSGPCPPSGTHRYRLTLYALDERTGLRDGASLNDALDAIEAAATARGRLTATYAR
jgi:Raf kinase inhibitor-like YbhB/YbcL family protein